MRIDNYFDFIDLDRFCLYSIQIVRLYFDIIITILLCSNSARNYKPKLVTT